MIAMGFQLRPVAPKAAVFPSELSLTDTWWQCLETHPSTPLRVWCVRLTFLPPCIYHQPVLPFSSSRPSLMFCSILLPQTMMVFGGTQIPPKSKLGRDCFDLGGNQFNGEVLFAEIRGCRAPQSYLLALTLSAGGVGRGGRAGRAQKAGPQGKEVPLARVPGRGTKLLMLYSGKQGLTVPREPSPAESRLGTATNGLSEHKMRILLPLCKWLLPPGAQQVPDPSQGSVVSRGRVERSWSVPLESGAGFSLAATASRLGFPPICLSAPDLSLPLC